MEVSPSLHLADFKLSNLDCDEDVGKVLAGIQVPPGKRADLETFLVQLGYPFIDETENPVYKKFMTTGPSS